MMMNIKENNYINVDQILYVVNCELINFECKNIIEKFKIN